MDCFKAGPNTWGETGNTTGQYEQGKTHAKEVPAPTEAGASVWYRGDIAVPEPGKLDATSGKITERGHEISERLGPNFLSGPGQHSNGTSVYGAKITVTRIRENW